jgi:hypothetical protein
MQENVSNFSLSLKKINQPRYLLVSLHLDWIYYVVIVKRTLIQPNQPVQEIKHLHLHRMILTNIRVERQGAVTTTNGTTRVVTIMKGANKK